jgi:hypothetical protein
MLYSFRTLFDAMLGSYNHISTSDPAWLLHTGVLVLHIFVSHVFLLNYLIAILSTTYEEEEPKGIFAYQSFRYRYVERFSISHKDQNGYDELVVHAPGPNLLFFILIPGLIKDEKMKRIAHIYSKIQFWVENVYLIVVMTI